MPRQVKARQRVVMVDPKTLLPSLALQASREQRAYFPQAACGFCGFFTRTASKWVRKKGMAERHENAKGDIQLFKTTSQPHPSLCFLRIWQLSADNSFRQASRFRFGESTTDNPVFGLGV